MDIRFVLQKAQKARKETKPIGLYKKLKKVIKKNMRKVVGKSNQSEIFALNNQMDIRTRPMPLSAVLRSVRALFSRRCAMVEHIAMWSNKINIVGNSIKNH